MILVFGKIKHWCKLSNMSYREWTSFWGSLSGPGQWFHSWSEWFPPGSCSSETKSIQAKPSLIKTAEPFHQTLTKKQPRTKTSVCFSLDYRVKCQSLCLCLSAHVPARGRPPSQGLKCWLICQPFVSSSLPFEAWLWKDLHKITESRVKRTCLAEKTLCCEMVNTADLCH